MKWGEISDLNALLYVDFLKVLSKNSSLACWFRGYKSRIKNKATRGKSILYVMNDSYGS